MGDSGEKSRKSFATCMSCMDGRVIVPLIEWIRKNFGVDCVDMITEAGMDGILSGEVCPCKESLIEKLDISLEKHGSRVICISGHSDCGGNPVDDETHRDQILKAVERVSKWKPEVTVAGLWVSPDWKVIRLLPK